MQFYNGATDSAQAYALHRIQWNFRYNVLCGTCPDDDLFRITITSARPDANGLYPSEGTFQVQSAPLPYFIPVPFFIGTFGAFVQMRTAIIIGQISLLLTVALAVVQRDFILWAIFWLFILTGQPALNDVSELNNWRDFLGLLALTLLASILLPLPGAMAQWLNI